MLICTTARTQIPWHDRNAGQSLVEFGLSVALIGVHTLRMLALPLLRIPLGSAAALLACSAGFASPSARPTVYNQMIAREAKIHGVPESFVHRIVMRESRYNPRLVHNHCFGLMQIKYPTARGMGYRGDARGLLDAQTNLTYAVPYLANAYRLADGNEERAAALFSSGYYYVAKYKKMQGLLRTASSPALIPEPTPPLARIPIR